MAKAQARTTRKNTQLPKNPSGSTLMRSDSSVATNEEDKRDVQDARRALKEARKKGSIPWEQVKRDLGL
jgi:hypothetical protein